MTRAYLIFDDDNGKSYLVTAESYTDAIEAARRFAGGELGPKRLVD